MSGESARVTAGDAARWRRGVGGTIGDSERLDMLLALVAW